MEVKIGPGETKSVKVKLKPLGKGQISVNSIPMGAEVYLDGRRVAETPAIIKDVPSGKHVLEFRLEGYKPKRVEVEVKTGETTSVSVTLEPEQE